MIISPINISPLSPKRSGVGATPLIPTMKHEWYFNNVQNASANIITIPDTGTVGGLDLSNPALANKPTQTSINGKIAYKGDGVDDYIIKNTNNIGKSYSSWMFHVVFKYDSSNFNVFVSSSNKLNLNNEGWHLGYNVVESKFQTTWNNSLGTQYLQRSNNQALVNGNDYIITFSWDGTNLLWHFGTTQIGTVASVNPISVPTTTNNLVLLSLIRGMTNFYSPSNIGYVGLDEYNLTNLTNNVNTLKTLYGIA